MGTSVDDRVEAGRQIVASRVVEFAELFGRVESEWKYDGSRVTQADLAISKALESDLATRFPEDQFLSEETDPGSGPAEVTAKYVWLVDPIDGTNNFARGIPACAISVALLENGKPIYGIIYDHMSRSLICGGAGRGVIVDERPAGISQDEPSPQSIVGAQHCEGGDRERDDRELQRLFKIRNLGSSAIQLAYVAVGWLDGVIAHRVNTWDIAAGVALLEEAGGGIYYFDTDPFPISEFDVTRPPFGYMAGTPRILKKMQAATGRV